MNKKFILGLGSQKTASSWLHYTLQKNKNCNFGYRKEYHVLDAAFSDLGKNQIVKRGKKNNADQEFRRLMQSDINIYTAYFNSLINNNIKVTGDFTPSHCLLDSNSFKMIQSYIEDAGFQLKIIFMMRDPIDRFWSAARMIEREMKRKGKILEKNFIENTVFEMMQTVEHTERSNYKSTIQNIEKAFPSSIVHYQIYENLFTSSSIKKIENFLGFSFDNVDFNTRVNQTLHQEIPDYILSQLSSFLQTQYQFCNSHFPETKQLWRAVEIP